MDNILSWLSSLITSFIEASGYFGVSVLMALESANIPIPSEIIMPFAGFLVSRDVFSFWPLIFVGALGNLIGSMIVFAQ